MRDKQDQSMTLLKDVDLGLRLALIENETDPILESHRDALKTAMRAMTSNKKIDRKSLLAPRFWNSGVHRESEISRAIADRIQADTKNHADVAI